jgi:hypothetical protein
MELLSHGGHDEAFMMIKERLRAARNSTGNHHDYKNAQGQSMPAGGPLLTPARSSGSTASSVASAVSQMIETIIIPQPAAGESPERYRPASRTGNGIFQAPDGTIYRERLLHPDTLKQMQARGDGAGLIRHPFATDEDEDEVHDLGTWRHNNRPGMTEIDS